MERNTEIFKQLNRNCVSLARGLEDLDHFESLSFKESAVQHLHLKKKLDFSKEHRILNEISKKCFDNNLAIITPAYLEAEREIPRPSLRVCISVDLNQDDINFALTTLKKCSEEVLGSQ